RASAAPSRGRAEPARGRRGTAAPGPRAGRRRRRRARRRRTRRTARDARSAAPSARVRAATGAWRARAGGGGGPTSRGRGRPRRRPRPPVSRSRACDLRRDDPVVDEVGVDRLLLLRLGRSDLGRGLGELLELLHALAVAVRVEDRRERLVDAVLL